MNDSFQSSVQKNVVELKKKTENLNKLLKSSSNK